MSVLLLVGLGGLVAGAAVVAVLCGKELRRMARFLRDRDAHSNARLTVAVPGRGFARLAAAVNDQLDAAQGERLENQQHQQEFQRDLASLSHDIRTPLMGAKGYVRLAQDEEGEEARNSRLDAAVVRLDAMETLLDQLFFYARASDPDVELDRVPVVVLPVLTDVLVGHYPAFEQRGWEPQVHFGNEALVVDADPEALARIFENLIGNALRHGSSAPVITERAGILTFSNEVPDPAGIDPEHLFERFYRGDAARSTPGSGLGLAVSASLAHAMGMPMTARLEEAVLHVDLVLADG